MSGAFRCLGKSTRAALCAIARHLRLRSDVFNHLLDDNPLPTNEVSSSVLVASYCHSSLMNGKPSSAGVKSMVNSEVEKGLLTLIAYESPGIQVCDPNGRWYLAEGGSSPGDLFLLTGKALGHATAGLRPASSYRVVASDCSNAIPGGRTSLAFRLMAQGNAILDYSPIATAGHVIPQSYVPISVSQFMDDLSTEEDAVCNRSDNNIYALVKLEEKENRLQRKISLEVERAKEFTRVKNREAAVLIICCLKFLKNRRPPLPPGPRGLPLLGSLPFLDPQLHSGFANLSRIYGPIFSIRFGTKLGVVITSPSLAKSVLKDHDAIFANRDVPAAAVAVKYCGSDIVWSPLGPEWRMLRRVCVHELLSSASLEAVYTLRRREVRATVARIHSFAASGDEVDVGEEIFLTVMGVVTGMLWGGAMEGGERRQVGSEFRKVVGEMSELLGKPNVSDFFPGLARFDIQGVQRQMKGLLMKFDRIFERVIEMRVKRDGEGGGNNNGSKPDFLQYMLKLKDNDESPFTMDHLKALLMDMVVGGTDTTSNTIEWAMARLMDKPKMMKKVQDELDIAVGRDNIVEEAHISKLPYIEGVIKEVLRLHPAGPLLAPRCPTQSCIVGGYTVPRGTRVFVNVWAIHRDPLLWPDPLEFEPERFVGADTKWDYSGNNFSYFPFGSGRRICAGIAVAEKVATYTLASLVHSFNWSLPKLEKLDLSEKFGLVLKKRTPLVAVPSLRLSTPELYK